MFKYSDISSFKSCCDLHINSDNKSHRLHYLKKNQKELESKSYNDIHCDHKYVFASNTDVKLALEHAEMHEMQNGDGEIARDLQLTKGKGNGSYKNYECCGQCGYNMKVMKGKNDLWRISFFTPHSNC